VRFATYKYPDMVDRFTWLYAYLGLSVQTWVILGEVYMGLFKKSDWQPCIWHLCPSHWVVYSESSLTNVENYFRSSKCGKKYPSLSICIVFVLYGLRVCYKPLQPKKFLKGLRTTVLDIAMINLVDELEALITVSVLDLFLVMRYVAYTRFW